jgi:hypothetical protein
MRALVVLLMMCSVSEGASHEVVLEFPGRRQICADGYCRIVRNTGYASAVSFAEFRGRTYLLTAAHVVDDAVSVKVGIGKGYSDAKLHCTFTDQESDIAVLSIEKCRYPPHRFIGDVGRYLKTDAFLNHRSGNRRGNLGRTNWVSPYVSSLTVRCTQGESGGAVLNTQGGLVGIIAAVDARGRNETTFTNLAGIRAALMHCGLSFLLDENPDEPVKIEPKPDPISCCDALAKKVSALQKKIAAFESAKSEFKGNMEKQAREIRLLKANIEVMSKELAELKANFLTIQIRDGDATATKKYKHGDTVKLKVPAPK